MIRLSAQYSVSKVRPVVLYGKANGTSGCSCRGGGGRCEWALPRHRRPVMCLGSGGGVRGEVFLSLPDADAVSCDRVVGASYAGRVSRDVSARGQSVNGKRVALPGLFAVLLYSASVSCLWAAACSQSGAICPTPMRGSLPKTSDMAGVNSSN